MIGRIIYMVIPFRERIRKQKLESEQTSTADTLGKATSKRESKSEQREESQSRKRLC